MIAPIYSLSAVVLAHQSLHGARLTAINRQSHALSLLMADVEADERAELRRRYAALRDEYTTLVMQFQRALDGEEGERGQRIQPSRHLVSN